MKKVICSKCGKNFKLQNWIYNNRIKASKSGDLFCSKKCARLSHTKEKSPNWKGGISKNHHNRYRKPYPLKYNARNTLQRAKKQGVIKKQKCQKCRSHKTEAHHPDYNKPLKIIWLCRKCHIKEHYENRV